MAYEKQEWKGRQGIGLNKYTKTQETETTVYLANTPDSVTEPGTPFSAERMNHIEDGIEEAHALVAEEAAGREDDDVTLAQMVFAETNARVAADQSLQNQIDLLGPTGGQGTGGTRLFPISNAGPYNAVSIVTQNNLKVGDIILNARGMNIVLQSVLGSPGGLTLIPGQMVQITRINLTSVELLSAGTVGAYTFGRGIENVNGLISRSDLWTTSHGQYDLGVGTYLLAHFYGTDTAVDAYVQLQTVGVYLSGGYTGGCAVGSKGRFRIDCPDDPDYGWKLPGVWQLAGLLTEMSSAVDLVYPCLVRRIS